MKILLVEDDVQIREVIMDYFENHAKQYELVCAEDGTKGLAMLRKERYDLLLLDIMLPGMSGFSILRELRKNSAHSDRGAGSKDARPVGAPCPNSSIPVIVITAKIREEDRLLGYELGCDDYVCKPFSIAELCAKIGAVLRRTKGEQRRGEEVRDLICGPIRIRTKTEEVFVYDQSISLSPKEYELLMVFVSHPNWIFTREMLLEKVWGYDYEGTERTVDNHVKKLRKNLGAAGKLIKTEFRKGYRLLADQEQ